MNYCKVDNCINPEEHVTSGHKCEQCGTSFDSHSKLIAHLNGVKGTPCKPKSCKHCGYTFTSYRYLIAHQNNSKKITCTHCSKVFCTNDHFQKHLVTK